MSFESFLISLNIEEKVAILPISEGINIFVALPSAILLTVSNDFSFNTSGVGLALFK